MIGGSETGDAGSPRITANSTGNAVAVWRQYDGDDYSIFANTYTDGSWGAAELIEYDSSAANAPQVASDNAANVIAVWKIGLRMGANLHSVNRGWGTPTYRESADATVVGGLSPIVFDNAGNGAAVWAEKVGDYCHTKVERFE